uniref:STICHEL DnaA-N-like alpha-beta domain-containing protein n=1 Tax=Lactuca sativa TaxID=4236 RepID=A0A9R1W348_LACSA|nr:hypothetical protein LSAT_V11C300127750 [Lactuca sativa]
MNKEKFQSTYITTAGNQVNCQSRRRPSVSNHNFLRSISYSPFAFNFTFVSPKFFNSNQLNVIIRMKLEQLQLLKTAKLDAILRRRAMQHREIQSHESDKFLSYFKPCIVPLEGGVATGFKKPEEMEFETRLYICKGKRVVHVAATTFDWIIITSPEAEIEKEMDIEKMDDETESPKHKEEHGLGLHTADIVMEENAHGDDVNQSNEKDEDASGAGNELVGVVSDENLLELLELAMSSNTAETVKRARELMELGVDSMDLMSQMATLIMDIFAGAYQVIEASVDSLFDEAEIERLKHALKLLSEFEKQLRLSSERSTWFTATLLQLGLVPSANPTPSGSSRRQSSRTTEDDPSATYQDIYFQKQRQDSQYTPQKSTPMYPPKPIRQNSASPKDTLQSMRQLMNGGAITASSVPHHDDDDDVIILNNVSKRSNSNILNDIWARCIEKCHSKTLRQLLHTYGNLVSISKDKGCYNKQITRNMLFIIYINVAGILVAYIVFRDKDIKSRANFISITGSTLGFFFTLYLCDKHHNIFLYTK